MIIQMRDVFMNYGKGTTILQGINFSIEKGEFVFLIGPNGAGKTTIFRLLNRELSPTRGIIIVAGYDLAEIKNSQIPYYRRKLGIVFQDFKLLPNRTVAQNIAFAMRIAGAKKAKIRKSVDLVLQWTDLMHRKDAFPEDISGGEQQRATIARAIINNPSIILADEPTRNLDPDISMEIMILFEQLNERGVTVIVATSDKNLINFVKKQDKKIIMIESGRIIT